MAKNFKKTLKKHLLHLWSNLCYLEIVLRALVRVWVNPIHYPKPEQNPPIAQRTYDRPFEQRDLKIAQIRWSRATDKSSSCHIHIGLADTRSKTCVGLVMCYLLCITVACFMQFLPPINDLRICFIFITYPLRLLSHCFKIATSLVR